MMNDEPIDELTSKERLRLFLHLDDPNHHKILFPLRDDVLFPLAIMPLTLTDKERINAVKYAAQNDLPLIAVAQKSPLDNPKRSDLFTVGTLCHVLRYDTGENDEVHVILQGITRARLGRALKDGKHGETLVKPVTHTNDNKKSTRLRKYVDHQLRQLAKIAEHFPKELYESVSAIVDDIVFADILSSRSGLELAERQELLEAKSTDQQLEKLAVFLNKQFHLLELERTIENKTEKVLDKAQRDYYLREKINVIQDELGEGEYNEDKAEIKEMRERLEQANMPEDVLKHSLRELHKMSRIPSSSPDRAVLYAYLEWMIRFPWNNETPDNTDLEQAKIVLDEDHFGLEDVKDRIVEFLAVRQMEPNHHGPILCLVGPPGVGKTSIGRSIARTMGRNFNRTSLGGLYDEAEIRGHRRTYVGALPGRIIQAMCTAGTSNPVIVLDEIDKLGKDFRGDPGAALLEVLDPEQNSNFSDHYLAQPTDLSKAMFILTANTTDRIPPALLDRLEVIRISGYTATEKLEIAKNFLLPRALKQHGLNEQQLSLNDEDFNLIISDYTHEAGVRNLERQIGKLCRKRVREIVEQKCPERDFPVLTVAEVKTYLGIPRCASAKKTTWRTPGLAHGLSWTAAGGELLDIETNIIPGKGHVTLTGNLGTVMKESIRAAITWVRNYVAQRGHKFNYYRQDIHVHVPEGAVPKDGPSAGVTIASVLASAISGKVVSPDIAMTGEISLTGRVMEVGGIKEKMLAAYNNDIRTVYLPAANEKDVSELPEAIRNDMNFVYVATLDELFGHIFEQ